MPEPNSFADCIRRIRGGDDEAAADLVRRYEPLIRREVRLHLEDRRLCRLLDSMDVCQSVLISFFVRAAAGQYDLDEPGQLVKLLARMTRNKVASAARAQGRQRRDHRRVTGAPGALDGVAAEDPSPSEMVAGKELLQRFQQGLSAEERQLADLRAQGLTWDEVAERLDGTAQARRMQLTRAVERIARELGLDNAGEE